MNKCSHGRFLTNCRGEFGNAFRDHEPAKAVPEAIVASRRRKSPRSGGIIPPRDSKASWAVNIRPKNWGNKDKIWMGKIKSIEEAQRIADIVFHYLGCGPVHFLFPDGRGHPPPFLNDNLQLLDSVEKRMKYVKDIAKGDAFHARRKELMDSVKEMVKYLTARQDENNFTASCNAVYPFTALCNIADPFAATCSIRSPPELGVERFDEAYGRRALSFDFPVLPQGKDKSASSFTFSCKISLLYHVHEHHQSNSFTQK
jgi:hypothetical protein